MNGFGNGNGQYGQNGAATTGQSKPKFDMSKLDLTKLP